MKKQTFYLLFFVFITFLVSCSDDNDIEPTIENLENVTVCGKTIEPDLAVAICVDGADFALPDEIVTFTSKLYTRSGIPSNSQFSWTISSGSMEILNVENTVDGLVANSIATIKFNADFVGNGFIGVNAENDGGGGYVPHKVELGK